MKKVLSLMLAVMLCVGMLPISAAALPVSAGENCSYYDEYGEKQNTKASYLTDGSSLMSSHQYLVNQDTTATEMLYVENNSKATLIITDGATLTVPKGIVVDTGATLRVYTDGSDAKLIVGSEDQTETKNGNGEDLYAGLYVDGGELILAGGTIIIRDKNYANETRRSSKGLYVYDGSLTVANCTVTAIGGDVTATDSDAIATSCGIILFNVTGFTVRNATVNANGGKAVSSSQCESFGLYSVNCNNFTLEDNAVLNCNAGEVTATSDESATYLIAHSSGMLAEANNKISLSSGKSKLNATGNKVTVNGTVADTGYITAESYGFYASGTLTIYGGDIRARCGTAMLNGLSTGTKAYDIYAGDYGTSVRVGNSPKLDVNTGYFYELKDDTGSYRNSLCDMLKVGQAFYDSADTIAASHEALRTVHIGQHNCEFKSNGYIYSCGECGRSYSKRPVTYLDENGSEWYCGSYSSIDTSDVISCEDGWYLLENDLDGIAVLKDTHAKIIIPDGVDVTIDDGITLHGDATLTVYAQSTGNKMGKVTVKSSIDHANGTPIDGISGTLIVNGGKITATGSDNSVNEAYGVRVHNMVMNGGEVTATGAKPGETDTTYGVNVYNDLTVNGGKLTSKTVENANSAKGISVERNYIQTGGTVEATRAKIKKSNDWSITGGLLVYGNATVSGGTLSVIGTEDDKTVYGDEIYVSETMTLSGGTISATSKCGNAYIRGETLKMSGGEIKTEKTVLFFYNYDISGGSAFTLKEGISFYSFTVSGNVTLRSFLPAGYAYVKVVNLSDEIIDFINLNTTTQLEGYEGYGYYITPCKEHSYENDVCEYCGTKKKVNKPSGSSEPTYSLTVTQPTTGGKIEVSNTSPTEGEVVVITPKAKDGYVVGEVIVKDASGNEISVTKNVDGSYSFTQPDSEVTIEVVFKSQANFKDVKSGAWYEEAVNFVIANGIMNGMSENYFYPNAKITRGMFATVLYNLAGKPEVTITNTYSDVKSTEYYAAPIAWATEQGIVNGMPNGEFMPNEPITREQMVKMLWVYLGSPEVTGDLSQFPDGDRVNDYAKTAMAWAIENGVVTGRANGTLDPRGSATRAEAATIFMNYYNK